MTASSLAQAPAAPDADCGAANLQRADELLQASSAARRQHSSLSLAWKLVPIDAQLKALKAQQQAEGTSPATCQKLASRIDAEQSRLLKLVPDLRLAASAPAPQMGPAAATLAPPAPQTPDSRTQQTCVADTAQSAADLAQRFVHFMQTAAIQPGALLPYQSFSRRLSALDAGLSARPDDCPGHRAGLAQLNTEFQQLVSMDARAAVPAGHGLPDGSMPLLSTPAAEACVADLRQGFRDSQAATSRSLLTLPEGPERANAQWLHQRVLWQQVDALARGPLSPDACEQARLALRAPGSVTAQRGGTTLVAAPRAVPALPAATAPAAVPVVPAPLQRQSAPAMATAAPSSEEDDHRACIEYTRHTYGQLEREGNGLKSSGRLSGPEAASFDRDLATYREWLRKGTHPIQCGVLADQLTKHLSLVRYASANLPAQPPRAGPPPMASVAQVPPASAPTVVARPAPSALPPVRPAVVAVPPVAALAPPTAAPPTPAPPTAAAPTAATPVAPKATVASASAPAPARARAPVPPQAPKAREIER